MNLLSSPQSKSVLSTIEQALKPFMLKPVYCALFIFALALACRLSYVLLIQQFSIPDNTEMQRIAVSLATGGVYGNIYTDNSGPTAHIAPLYAVILALIYKSFGYGTHRGYLTQQILTSIITSLSIALLPIVARKAGLRAGSGLMAGLLMALLPLNLWVETSGTWEQPYSALTLILILLTFLELQNCQWRSWRLMVVAGTILSVAALLTPTLLPVGVVLLLAGFVTNRQRHRILLAAGIIAIVIVIFIAPWIYRNYYALGEIVPIRSNFGLELWLGNHPGATGTSFETPFSDLGFLKLNHPYNSHEEAEKLVRIGEIAYMREKGDLARAWIRDHPSDFISLCVRRFRLFWFPPPDMWSATSRGRFFKSFLIGLLSIGAICGLIHLFTSKHSSRLMFIGVVLVPSLPYLVTLVELRYRYPILGLLALMSCDFFIWVPQIISIRAVR